MTYVPDKTGDIIYIKRFSSLSRGFPPLRVTSADVCCQLKATDEGIAVSVLRRKPPLVYRGLSSPGRCRGECRDGGIAVPVGKGFLR